MKFVCISDTHNKHRQLILPKGDVLLHSGDICFANKGDTVGEERHLRDFNEWLGEQDFEHKIVVAGNHDFIFERQRDFAKSILTNATYLDQEMVEIEGFKIYGEPRQPEFFNWAFNIKRNKMADVWDMVPENVDILVTHGPPHGYGDVAADMHGNGWGPPKMVHVGCKAQADMIVSRSGGENPLKLVVCGHVHSGYGQWVLYGGKTRIVNASVVNEHYSVANKPIVVEL